jgi:hypothetical protein
MGMQMARWIAQTIARQSQAEPNYGVALFRTGMAMVLLMRMIPAPMWLARITVVLFQMTAMEMVSLMRVTDARL